MLRNILLLPIVVGLAILLALWARTPPSGDGGTGFRLAEAQATLEAIAREPRPVGSAGHDRARDWLVARLQGLGLEVSTQAGTGVRQANFDKRRKGSVSVSPYENIIAVLPGRDRGAKAVLLMAHYDSVAYAPGASDDGAGVAAVLETARVLAGSARAGQGPLRDTIFLLTDAEEVGLIGAQEFFDGHPLAARVGAVVNAEARGSKGRAFMFQTSAGNRALIDLWAGHAVLPTGNSLAGDVYRLLPNDTDLSVPLAKGAAGINAAYIDGLHDYHMPTDSIARTDMRSVQHLGNFALTTTRALANAAELPRVSGGNATYFDFFGLFVIRYPGWMGWVLVVAGFVGLGFAGIGRLGVSWKQAAMGTLAMAVLFSGTGAAMHFLANFVYGKDMTAMRDRINEMDLALWVFVAFCAGAVLFVRMRAAMWVGSAALLLLAAVAAQVWLPGASWLFDWAGLIGVALIALAARKGLDAPVTLYISAIVGGLWGAMLLAGVIATYMSVAPATPAPVALIVPFAAALIGPVIIVFCKAGWGRPGGAALLVATLAGLGWFAATDRFSTRYPESADLFHYSDGSKSWWATGSAPGNLPAGTQETLSPKGFVSIQWHGVPAPAAPLAPPVISQSRTGTTTTIRFTSAAAPRTMQFSLTPSATLASATINGKPVSIIGKQATRIAWRPETPNAELVLSFANAPPGTIAVYYLYAIPGLPPGAPPARGTPTDWTHYNGTRTLSGSTNLSW